MGRSIRIAAAAFAAAMAVGNQDAARQAAALLPKEPGPVHHRGRHKPNARRQAGRKTLPRKSHG